MAMIAAKTTPRLFASARGRLLRAATAFAALCAATAALVGGAAVGPAAADTIGGAGITGYGVLSIFQLPTPVNFDPNPANQTAIDLLNTGYSAVRNDYIGFVMGLSGS